MPRGDFRVMTTCAVCAKSFVGRAANARYCSEECCKTGERRIRKPFVRKRQARWLALGPEEWRPVPTLEGMYSVSCLGRVRRDDGTRAGRTLAPAPDTKRYRMASLTRRDGSHWYPKIHRLVMAAFVGERPPGKEINHKNGIKADNRLTNLEYVSPKENVCHRRDVLKHRWSRGEAVGNSIINADTAAEIKRRLAAGGESSVAISRALGVALHIVKSIKNGKTWKHIAATACALLVASLATAGVSKPRKVTTVSDGDTIHIAGIAERLRLIGVDAPEVHHGKGGVITSTELCGREAWAFLDEVLRGQEVQIEQHGWDHRGRRLVYAWRASDHWFVNLGVIQSGYATVLRGYKIPGPASRRERLEAAESAARLTPVFCSAVPVQ